jgi:tetratricopeptide (TPR) repeat protein
MNWGIALEGIKENPVLGWGQENYMYVFPMFYDPGMYGQEPWFDRTHNVFLDWTIQGGLVALVLYLALSGAALVAVWRSTSLSSTEKNILTAMFAGYAIHNLFVFDNYSSYLMFFTSLGLVVHHQHKSTIALPSNARISQLLAATLMVLVLVAGYVVIVKPYTVARDLISVYKSQDANEVLAIYEKILEKDTFGNFEATTRFLSDAPNFLRVDNAEFQKKYMDAARGAGEKSVADAPNSVRALEFYGNFLVLTDNESEAIPVLERARELAPDRQNNLYVLGFAYVNEKQFDKAVEIFKHAYEVAPENVKARNYYGGALILAGDKAGNDYIGEYSHNDPFMFSVFNIAGRYQDVIQMLEKRIADQPDNYQQHISLAVAYFKAGNRAKSIEIIRNVIAQVPAFKEQGEYFIKEVQAGRNPTR